MSDNVNHPSHYTDGKYETIEFIERNRFDYHDGNAIKYISRAGKKDPDKLIEDLEKALWYINRADHKLDYDGHAITVHDYILDKKLSPALAYVIALIEMSCYKEAYEMLEAEIERLKKEEKDEKCPYFGSVVCTYSNIPWSFTIGRVYNVLGDRIATDLGFPFIFSSPIYSVDELIDKCYEEAHATAQFIEFKGEA